MKTAIYGLRLAWDIAAAYGTQATVLRPGVPIPDDTRLVFWAARSRSRQWHQTVNDLMALKGTELLVVGSDAAYGVNLSQGPEYHAEKAAEWAVVQWLAANGGIANMVSPKQLSYSGGAMLSSWVAKVCVDFALLASKLRLTGQHLKL